MRASLRRTATLARLELKNVFTEPRLLAALYGVPLILTVVAGLAFNYPGQAPDRLAVQDLDGSALSAKLSGLLLHNRSLSTLTINRTVDPLLYVKENPYVVVAVIPAGMENQILVGIATPLKVYKDRRGQSLAGPADAAIRRAGEVATAVSVAVQTARAAAIAENAPDGGAANAKRAEMTALKNFSLDQIKVETTLSGTSPSRIFSRQAQFATGNGVMFMMFCANALAVALVVDRRERRLARALWTRLRLREVVLARVVAITITSAFVMALMIATSALLFGMSLGPSVPLLALITLSVAVAVSGYALLLIGIGRGGASIAGLGLAVSLALAAAGGSWWPIESEPPWLQTVGHVSINAWASDAFHSLLFFNGTLADIVLPLVVLLVLAIVMGSIGSWLFARQLRPS